MVEIPQGMRVMNESGIVAPEKVDSLENILFMSKLNPTRDDIVCLAGLGLGVLQLEFDGELLVAASRLPVYEEPMKPFSPGSKAEYWVWSEDFSANPPCGWILQHLRPYSETSRHYHKAQTEVFRVLEGRFRLETSRSDSPDDIRTRWVLPGETAIIPPHTYHRLTTTGRPSLTVIEMRNIVEGNKDHHYR